MKKIRIMSGLLVALFAFGFVAPTSTLEAKKKEKEAPAKQIPSVQKEEFKGIAHTVPKRWNLVHLDLTDEPFTKLYMLDTWHDPENQPVLGMVCVPLSALDGDINIDFSSYDDEDEEVDENGFTVPDYLKDELISQEEVKINGIPMTHVILSSCSYEACQDGDGEWIVESWVRMEQEMYCFQHNHAAYLAFLLTPEGFNKEFTKDLETVVRSIRLK